MALATGKLPDGSHPSIADLANLSVFVFSAGQDTTLKLLTCRCGSSPRTWSCSKGLRYLYVDAGAAN
jgi:hypothetical protein